MKQTRLLLVDDEASILKILQRIIRRVGGDCVSVTSAEEARNALQRESFDLLLSDLYLHGESGMDLIKWVQEHFPHIGVIMISGEDDAEVAVKALEMGAYGYVIKPFKVNEIVINISNALRRQQLEAEQRARHDNLEQLVAKRTAELHQALHGVVLAVANTVEFRDPYTAGHQSRVGELAQALALELGCSSDQSEGIYLAGLIHDLGKVSIPAEILSKPTKLLDIEFSLIKAHPQVGYDILKDITFPWPIAHMVLQHHERLDGSGYPQGLTEGNILFESKVLAVADVVEAMSSHRPYRPGLGLDKALDEVHRNREKLFDPQVVDACLRLFQEKDFSWDGSGDKGTL
ncbi:MAG: response regulator [Desulfovermiculus sp.]|nr:response regulator [Desulfovermiculus sp.]